MPEDINFDLLIVKYYFKHQTQTFIKENFMNTYFKIFLVIVLAITLPVLSEENSKKNNNNTAFFSLPDTQHNVDIDMISKTTAVRIVATITGSAGAILIKNGIENSVKNNQDGSVSLNIQGLISITGGLILAAGSMAGIMYSDRLG